MTNPTLPAWLATPRLMPGIGPGHARKRSRVSFAVGLLGALLCAAVPAAGGANDATAIPANVPLTMEFAHDVTPRLQIPDAERVAYAGRLQSALAAARVTWGPPQYVVLVDRNPNVQAALIFWGSPGGGWGFVGATPVSTGLPGRYEHFTTPLGVFDHSTAQPDFRAKGTKNSLGFRGYGTKGMRIYDFGWVAAPRGWGDGAMGVLRLQMHATDPVLAAPLFGSARSEGCVRIPAPLNAFIDHHGLIDAAYEQAHRDGSNLWVLARDRMPTASAGRYLVVVDSERQGRPDWSPKPAHR